mgnify:CR=1 FL=1
MEERGGERAREEERRLERVSLITFSLRLLLLCRQFAIPFSLSELSLFRLLPPQLQAQRHIQVLISVSPHKINKNKFYKRQQKTSSKATRASIDRPTQQLDSTPDASQGRLLHELHPFDGRAEDRDLAPAAAARRQEGRVRNGE